MWLQRFLSTYKMHLLIVFIATFIWIHVKTEMDYELVHHVKILPKNVNPEYIITNNYTDNIPVLFKGKGKSLLAIHNTVVELLVDLNQTTEKKFFSNLKLKSIRIYPPLVNITPVEFIEKDTLQFYQDHLRYKKIPVEYQLELKTSPGFTLVGPLEFFPKDITVTGPASLLNEINSVKTETLSLINLENDISGNLELVNSYPGRVVLIPKTIEYKANIQTLGEKILDDIPVQVLNIPANVKASLIPSTLSLKIIGGVDIISDIQRKDIVASIDFQQFKSSNVTALPAIIKIPEDITLADIYPETFQIKIK